MFELHTTVVLLFCGAASHERLLSFFSLALCPACLFHCSDKNDTCYVETSNLDGETSLKLRRVRACVHVSVYVQFAAYTHMSCFTRTLPNTRTQAHVLTKNMKSFEELDRLDVS